jgi:O-antigen/teichoic acid export membrane protein
VPAGRVFLLNAFTLVSGTIAAQFVTFCLSFVLTRLYLPSEFGHYSIFAGAAAVVAGMGTGAFDRVILLARSDREARRVATLTIALATASALVVSLAGVALTVAGLTSRLPLTSVDLILLIPLFMICFAGAQTFNYTSLRGGAVRTVAAFRLSQSVIAGAVQVGWSFFKGIPGLILGFISGWALLAAGGLWLQARAGHMASDLRPPMLLALFRRYARYPRYVMPNEALDNLSNQLPALLIGTLLSLSAAGHYGLAIMLLSAPAALVGQAIGQAFLQHVGRDGDDPDTLRLFIIRIWVGLALVGAVPFGVIFVFGPTIFEAGFGPVWRDAGAVAQSLAILLFVRFCSSPTSTIYLKLGMQREQWWFVVAAAVYRGAAYSLAAFGYGLETMIAVHAVSEIIGIIAYNLVAMRALARLRQGSRI